ncbi:hypothetical protein [uncultured phage cr49_1]|jgi:hypothetical protein|uniref:Uncharacterized protein n=1 Tax=uncultured phage cr49_1 TaxID=2986402 RepID=A0AAE7RVW4_9CAUD|nr:hypothetical protein M1M42_gp18 [uncultured phage cr49_1]QWM89069.1 hypothetical protein [uncultured phage cr49_1]DAG88240.1 MAG TPA: hypothetical protein [Crassvirales sp.]
MYLIGNNFDGQVIDEANYKVFGKKQVVSFNVPKSVISTTKKFIIIASMLHELNHNETVVYGNIVSTLRNFFTKGINTRIVKFDDKFFLKCEGEHGINRRNARNAINGLIKKGVLGQVFTPNKKLYTDRAMLNPNDTPDNVIEGNVECIVINL